MHRRAFLASLSAGLIPFTGCIADNAPGSSTSTPHSTETGDVTERTPSNDQSETPKAVRLTNRADRAHRIRVAIERHIEPACQNFTPPCEQPAEIVSVLDNKFEIVGNCSVTIMDAVERTGTVHVTATARAAGRATMEWDVDESAGNIVISIAEDDTVTIRHDV